MLSCRKWIFIATFATIVFFGLCIDPLFALGSSPESDEEEQTQSVYSDKNFDDSDFYDDLTDDSISDDELLFSAFDELDQAFAAKDENQFRKILKKYSNKQIYPQVEEYSKKQINRFIIDNEIAFVLSSLYVLIDVNIDCGLDDDEAIEMYYIFYESYALQKLDTSAR